MKLPLMVILVLSITISCVSTGDMITGSTIAVNDPVHSEIVEVQDTLPVDNCTDLITTK